MESKRPDKCVAPSEEEVATFQKMMELMDAYRKTHVFIAAIKLGVFKALHSAKLPANEVAKSCGVHESKKLDPMLDILTIEGMLVRETNDDGTVVYRNSCGAELLFSDSSSATQCGGMDMLTDMGEDVAKLLHLAENLRAAPGEEKGLSGSGHGCHGHDGHGGEKRPDCHADESEEDWGKDAVLARKSAEMYMDFEGFMRIGFNLLAEKFDFSKCNRLLDIGGGTAQLSRILCRRNEHLQSISMDLGRVQPAAEARMKEVGSDVADRIRLVQGNCLKDELPSPVDVVVIANVLHGFETTELQALAIDKAFKALSPGGHLIVIDDFIDVEKKYDNGIYAQLSREGAPLADHSHGPSLYLAKESFKQMCEASGFVMAPHIDLAASMMSAAVAVKPC